MKYMNIIYENMKGIEKIVFILVTYISLIMYKC